MPLPPDDSQVIEEGKNLGEPEAVAVPSSPAAEQAKSDTAESKPETNEFGIPSDSAHEAENPAEAKPAEARDAEPEKATSEKSWLLKVAENTKAIFTTLSSLFLSILLLVLIISLCRELTHSTVILELLDVPEDVKDNGLTASAFSGELSDRISSIQKLSLSKNTRRLAEPIWDQPDIQVPGSNISFRSVSQWLKQRIDLPGIAADIRLSGELIEQNGKLRLVVRRSDQSVDTSSAVSAEGTTIAELISKGAESITRLIDPVTLASYYSFREDRNMKYRKTIDVIKYTIASGDDESKARAYNLWGGILADQDNASNALHMYENAITHNAKFAEANVNWANTLLFELSEFAEAIAKYKAALDVNPTLASAHNGWGLALDSLERPDEALTQFDLAIHLDSNDYWPYLNKANILSDTGKRKEALFLYEKARRLVERQVFRAEDEKNSTLDRSHYTDAYQALCAILIGTGDFKGAITIGEESETLDDTDPDAQMCLGKALSNAGRLDDAERHFRRATGLRTRWVSPLNELGNLAMRRGKYDEAETFFRSIVNLEPTYSWGWSNWGRALFAEGKYWQGMLYLYNGAKLHPRGGNLDVEIRYNYLNVGKYAASAERFLHAIKLNGNDPGQHLALAFSLQRRGKPSEAIGEFSRAVELAESLQTAHKAFDDSYGLTADEYAAWGSALNNLGDRQEAKKTLEHALEIDPTNTFAHTELANVLLSDGKTNEAIGILTEINKANPRDPYVQITLGTALVAGRRLDEAAEHYQSAVKLNSQIPDAYIGDAERLSAEGNSVAAIERLRQASESYPESVWASLRLADKLFDFGKYDEALKQASKNLARNFNSFQSLFLIGRILNYTGFDAGGIYETALRSFSSYVHATTGSNVSFRMSLDDYSTWGQFLRFAGRPKEALKKYELMLNIDEHSSEAFLGLGFAFQQLGKIDDAMKMFDKARENDVTGEIALASLLVQNGKVNEGLSHYTKASEVNADSVYLLTAWADSLVNIAKSDQELDKPKVVEAIDKYKRAALLNPWLVSTYQSMKAACGLVGDNGGVEECVDETNRIQEAIRKVIDQYQIIQTINGL